MHLKGDHCVSFEDFEPDHFPITLSPDRIEYGGYLLWIASLTLPDCIPDAARIGDP
jgi:hypothetical protein